MRRTIVATFLMLIASAALSLGALTEREFVAEVGLGSEAAWSAGFQEEFAKLAAATRIAPPTYGIALRALSGQRLSGSPGETAQLVFSLCTGIDRGLRKGLPPGEVLFEARQSAHAALSSGNPAALRETVGQRLAVRLRAMGSEVSGDMGNRLGPQAGPRARGGPQAGGPPEGLPGPDAPMGGGPKR